MSLTTLADAITRVRNGQLARHLFVIIPHSKMTLKVLELLAEQGFIGDIEMFEERKGVRMIKASLRYHRNASVISKIQMVSKPGRRRYFDRTQISKHQSMHALSVLLLSTSKGIMTAHEAIHNNVGGEALIIVK